MRVKPIDDPLCANSTDILPHKGDPYKLNVVVFLPITTISVTQTLDTLLWV